MPNISEFQLGIDGKAYVEKDNGQNSVIDLTETVTNIKSKIRNSIAKSFNNNSIVNTPWFKPATWQASTQYYAGQVVVGLDGVNTYICKGAGTSAGAGGPTGTGYSLITDGTCTWYWKGKVRGLANATTIVTQDLIGNLTPSIPNAKIITPSLTNRIGYWAGGVVEYNPQGSGDTVDVRGPNVSTAASPAYNSTPGASLTFYTDSTKFILAAYNSIYAGITFTVEINDRFIDDSVVATVANKNPGGYLFDLTNIPGAVGNFNKVKITSTNGFFSIARKIYIEPSASIYAPSNSNRWTLAVEGDSLTAGGNGTPYHAGLDWVSQAATTIGCDNASNMGQGGTGFLNNRGGAGTTYIQRIERLASLNADVYYIAGNYNDSSYPAADQITATLTYLRKLRELQPNSIIILSGINPLQGDTSAVGTSLYNCELNLKTAFDKFNDPNSYWVPIATASTGPWITGTGATNAQTNDGNKDKFYVTTDGHPIQRGVDFFAQKYVQVFNSIFN